MNAPSSHLADEVRETPGENEESNHQRHVSKVCHDGTSPFAYSLYRRADQGGIKADGGHIRKR
jgi:hypothetical protein